MPCAPDQASTIYVSNLLPMTSEDAVRHAFSKFGTVTSLRLVRTFCFVTFSERSAADKALRMMHNSVSSAGPEEN